MTSLFLTPEQQAVVAHNHGPALVFAVAGAGKTTAMVHRIERLIREGVFPATRILATSFSRATVTDIRQALLSWPHCAGVSVSTLHAVGLQILRQAADWQLLEGLQLSGHERSNSESFLLKRSLARARQLRLDLPQNLDEQDFLSYVSVCKGNFAYPDPEALALPETALKQVSAAKAPPELPHYLELFHLYEALRQSENLITFDDMLLSAWENLHRHPELLDWAQNLYEAVLVDEFQDVNAVQNELLDLLTQHRRHYMAIGDDDQTIYEWRGASPRFILDFPERYQAQKYLLRENFRSQASQLALANRVIVHNRQREPKALLLTRGFEGQTRVSVQEDEVAQAQQLVLDIMKTAQQGYGFEQQAILVRLYAQTPYLEQALIEAHLPYRITGSVPFYRRAEIRTLLAYLQLARYERDLRQGFALTGSQWDNLNRLWQRVANRPVRYLNKHWLQWLPARMQSGKTLVESLQELSEKADTAYQRKLTERLAQLLDWLCREGLDGDAGQTLQRMESDLKYCKYLRKSSGFPETGEGRALTVEALLNYAQGRGNCQQFEDHLQELAQAQEDGGEVLTLTSIFRAKGLEWPVVYVPHCNQGYIPYSSAHSLEEERRLFYVAITRSREQLFLYALKELPLSRFLNEAAYQETLSEVQEARTLLERPEAHWEVPEILTLIRHSRRLQLHQYLKHWWQERPRGPQSLQHQAGQILHLAQSENLLECLSLSLHDLQQWQAAPELLSTPPTAPEDLLSQYLQELRATAAAQQRQEAPLQESEDFSVGDQVWSENFGYGTVQACQANDKHGILLEVSFENSGERKILPKFAALHKIVS